MFVALPVLFACVPAAEPEGAPSAWRYTPEPADVTSLSTTELEGAIEAVVDTLMAIDPRTAPDAFDEAMLHVGGACPQTEVTGPQTVVAGDCTTNAGWTWLGVGAVSHMQNFRVELGEIDEFHYVWDYCVGNAQVFSAATGERYEMLGMSWYRDYEADTGRALAIELWGEFQVYDVPRFEDTWIARDLGVEMYVELAELEGGWEGTWTAGVSRLDGTVWAFSFDDLAVTAACPAEPTGEIDVQDAAGTWHTVVFDGDTTCDGCGVGRVGDTPLGEVCADLSRLVSFTEDPWAG